MEKRPTETKLAMLIQVLWYSKCHCEYLVKAVCSLAVCVTVPGFSVLLSSNAWPLIVLALCHKPLHSPKPQTQECVNMQTDRHIEKSEQQQKVFEIGSQIVPF